MSEEDPYLDPAELRSANERWDMESHEVAMKGRVNPSWNEAKMVVRGELTDKKIAHYAKMGFYSEEFREFRRKRMAKSSARKGNFVQSGERLIYSPQ